MTKGTTRRRRSPGEGSVYRAGERWAGALAWTTPDGRRHRRVVYGRTAAEARDKLDALRRDLRLGLLAPSRTPLADFLTAWLERERLRVRASTWRSREQHVRLHLIPAFGRRQVEALTPSEIERFLSGLVAAGRSPRTAAHIRATLRRALADAVRDGLIGRNPAALARPVYVPRQPIRYLAARDVGTLIEATRDDPYGPIFAILATAGLRLGEALGLRWDDVDFGAGTLRVERSLVRAPTGEWAFAEPKSPRSRRLLPLTTVARDALLRQRDRQRFARARAPVWQDPGLVFADEIGRPLAPWRVQHAFSRAVERAGIPRVRLHDLRHSAATTLLAAGVPLATVAEWLGHSSVVVTNLYYAAVTPRMLEDAAAAMDRALGGET